MEERIYAVLRKHGLEKTSDSKALQEDIITLVDNEKRIKQAVKLAVKQYRLTFELLAKV